MDRLWITIPAFVFMLVAKCAMPAELTTVYSMANCQPCKRVKAELDSRGVKQVKVCKVSAASIAPYYPYCVYSDGGTDSGYRFLSGQCGAARKVKVTEWIEKEKK